MEYVYAVMLLHKAGKEINEANVKKVLDAAGVSVDDGRVKALVAALSEVDIEQAIKEAAVPMAAAPAAAGQTAAAPVAEKKEEKKEEKAPEQAAAGLGALFG